MIRLLEGLLFMVGSDGISIKDAALTLKLNEQDFLNLLAHYEKDLENENRAFHIHRFGDKIKLVTKEEDVSFYEENFLQREIRVTTTMLEVLAIVLYHGPLSVREIDDIRGVSSRDMINKLESISLVEANGRGVNNATLYSVTEEFLDNFSISNKDAHVTELVDVPDLESGFLEFESLAGYYHNNLFLNFLYTNIPITTNAITPKT